MVYTSHLRHHARLLEYETLRLWGLDFAEALIAVYYVQNDLLRET